MRMGDVRISHRCFGVCPHVWMMATASCFALLCLLVRRMMMMMGGEDGAVRWLAR